MAVNTGIIAQVTQQQQQISSARPLQHLVQIASQARARKDNLQAKKEAQEARSEDKREARLYREEVRIDAAKIRAKERELNREDRKTQLVMSELLGERTRLETSRINALEELKAFSLSENDINMTNAYPDLVDMTKQLFDRDIEAYNVELLNPLRKYQAELVSKLGKLKAAKAATEAGAFDAYGGENNILQRVEFEEAMQMLRDSGTKEWLMAGYEAGYKTPTAASIRTATNAATKPYKIGAQSAYGDMLLAVEAAGGLDDLVTDEVMAKGMPGYTGLQPSVQKQYKKELEHQLLKLKNISTAEDFIEGANMLTGQLVDKGIRVSILDIISQSDAAEVSYNSMVNNVGEIRTLETEAREGSLAARSLNALKSFSKTQAEISATDTTGLQNLYEAYASRGLYSEEALQAMQKSNDVKMAYAPTVFDGSLTAPVDTLTGGDSMTLEEARGLDMDEYLPYIFAQESRFDNKAVNKGWTDKDGVWHDNAFKSVDIGLAQINSQHYDRGLLPAIIAHRGEAGGQQALEAMNKFHAAVFESYGVSPDDTEGMQRLLEHPEVSEKAARYLMKDAVRRGKHPLFDWGADDTSKIGTARRIFDDLMNGVSYDVPENIIEMYEGGIPAYNSGDSTAVNEPLLPDLDPNEEAQLQTNDTYNTVPDWMPSTWGDGNRVSPINFNQQMESEPSKLIGYDPDYEYAPLIEGNTSNEIMARSFQKSGQEIMKAIQTLRALDPESEPKKTPFLSR